MISDFEDGVPEQNNTFLVGTFPSQLINSSSNATTNAARALWHFAQVWFQNFPEYKPNDNRVSIWTESYGGKYGPAFAAFFQEQNEKIANQTWTDAGETYPIHLDTLGIINGCVDSIVQEPSYPQMAYNNTYGIEAINQTIYEAAMSAFEGPGGVRELIETCRRLASESDPENQGNNATVNEACVAASDATSAMEGPYIEYSGRNYYDIAAIDPDPFPPNYYIGWLNQPHVQQALGVPVNYTNPGGNAPYYGFQLTGDYARGGYLEDLSSLIEDGIKVALVYGDRDYACNWIGGEAVSLAVKYSHSEDFASAGYANITVNSSYVGGLVRQYGNFSFSRVFNAGHEVPAYQAETSYELFRRATFNLDMAGGKQDTAAAGAGAAGGNMTYKTTGLSDTWSVKNVAPESDPPVCYTYNPLSTCTEEQLESVIDGTAVIQNYIVMDNYTSGLFPGLANKTNGVNETAGGSGSGGGGASASGTPAAGNTADYLQAPSLVYSSLFALMAVLAVWL